MLCSIAQPNGCVCLQERSDEHDERAERDGDRARRSAKCRAAVAVSDGIGGGVVARRCRRDRRRRRRRAAVRVVAVNRRGQRRRRAWRVGRRVGRRVRGRIGGLLVVVVVVVVRGDGVLLRVHALRGVDASSRPRGVVGDIARRRVSDGEAVGAVDTAIGVLPGDAEASSALGAAERARAVNDARRHGERL
jgi:hypothetical protein